MNDAMLQAAKEKEDKANARAPPSQSEEPTLDIRFTVNVVHRVTVICGFTVNHVDVVHGLTVI
jgi:hypothetical protein